MEVGDSQEFDYTGAAAYIENTPPPGGGLDELNAVALPPAPAPVAVIPTHVADESSFGSQIIPAPATSMSDIYGLPPDDDEESGNDEESDKEVIPRLLKGHANEPGCFKYKNDGTVDMIKTKELMRMWILSKKDTATKNVNDQKDNAYLHKAELENDKSHQTAMVECEEHVADFINAHNHRVAEARERDDSDPEPKHPLLGLMSHAIKKMNECSGEMMHLRNDPEQQEYQHTCEKVNSLKNDINLLRDLFNAFHDEHFVRLDAIELEDFIIDTCESWEERRAARLRREKAEQRKQIAIDRATSGKGTKRDSGKGTPGSTSRKKPKKDKYGDA